MGKSLSKRSGILSSFRWGGRERPINCDIRELKMTDSPVPLSWRI